jgi:hypothetical protein
MAIFSAGYALVVGTGGDLPQTVADAHKIASTLQDPQRCGYPVDQVGVLTDAAATRAAVLAGLDRLAAQTAAHPSSTALVYFSGHASAAPNNYLLPFGYDAFRPADTCIAASEFTAKLQAIRAERLLVLLDCCHAAAQAQFKDVSWRPNALPVEASLAQGSGRVLLASSRSTEKSFTGEQFGLPYSVFTAALLEAFAGYGAAERDGYVRVVDLAMYVGRRVWQITKERQNPVLKLAQLQENFAIAFYNAGTTAVKGWDWQMSGAGLLDALVGESAAQRDSWRRQLQNRQDALLLIEERIAEYIDALDIPLQLLKNKRQTEAQIHVLRQKLGLEI